jgi:iron complex transport system substrate-binding protein
MQRETDELVRTVPHGDRPRVFVVLDVKPIYTVGNRSYIASLIAMAGGTNIAHIGAAYGRYSAEALLAEQPDVIVVDPVVGFHSVEREEPWRSLRAVRNKRVAQIPDPDTLLEPGPRYIEGLRWLIAVLHQRPQT